MAAVTSAATAAAARIGAALSDAQYFESSMVRVEDIRRQLDSRSTKDKLDAMKRVIALISLGKDASTFFPDVVKNVVATSLDVKKLVYLYLVHYAEHKQDLALLAINSFQKDLSDHNQHIRALSLRVLSSIRVKVILQVVILAINNAAKDSSPYVRKAAAHAISKVCALDSASKDLLMEPLDTLVSDRSTQVMGSAIAAFDDVCPYNWAMIHPHFRRICKSLPGVEPWGQIAIIHMLLRYARTHFSQPKANLSNKHTSSATRNPDLSLLINSIAPLFVSLNHSVVASALAVSFHLATPSEFCVIAVKPLMRLVCTPDDGGQAAALHIAAAVAVRYPHVLIPHVSEFYVSSAHSAPIRNLRVRVLMTICAAAGQEGGIGSHPHARRTLLAELKDYLFRYDKVLAAAAARAIGCLATAHPPSTPAIVKVLSSVVASAYNPAVVSESIAVLRRLLQRHPTAQAKALPQLIAMLLAGDRPDAVSIRDPSARSSIIWLIAEFFEKVEPIATEALRLLARSFASEAPEVKVQILNLAAKIVICGESKEGSASLVNELSIPRNDVRFRLLEYVVSCARYDRDYDVRDKARILQSLFISQSDSVVLKAARSAFLSRKPVPPSESGAEDYLDANLDVDVVIGSMPHILTGRRLFGFRPLEPWADEDSEASLRDTGGAIEDYQGERNYVGVSSTDFAGASKASGVSWNDAHVGKLPGVSSTSVRGGSISAIAGGSMHVGGNRFSMPTTHTVAAGMLGRPSRKIIDVDPENFYKEAEEEDDEEDDEDDDDDDDDDGDDDDDDEDDDDEDGDEDVEGGDDAEEKSNGGTPTDYARYTKNGGNRGRTHSENTPDLLLSDSASIVPISSGNIEKKTIKPTSEYDLDALLGGISLSDTPAQEPVSKGISSVYPSSSTTHVSPWFRVLESWNAGGLEVETAYKRSMSTAGADVTPMILRVTNRGKVDVGQVSFSSRSDDAFAALQSVTSLSPGESKEVNAEARFRGKSSGVRFAVRVGDGVVGDGEFKPSIGYVVRPRPGISPGEFADSEKSLTGMLSSEATVTLQQPKQNDWMNLSTNLKEKLLEACFVSHIKTSVGSQGLNSTERFSSVFCGFLPSATGSDSEQRPVLIRITVNALNTDSGCACVVWIGCEDVLFSANLMQLCRTVLLSIDRQ